MHDYPLMFIIMFVSGILSTMNVWVDKYQDVRLSVNDVYMTLLMTGWMFFFMGIFYMDKPIILFGLTLLLLMFWCIRTQFLVNQSQYIMGMIPHHSMALHMSKKLLNNKPVIEPFLITLIHTQEKEIEYLKAIKLKQE
jgi:membrane protein insertase Oxa1/YidC/SpoIIIJ